MAALESPPPVTLRAWELATYGPGPWCREQRRHLKGPHGTVPDDGLGIGQNLVEADDRGGSDIQGHPALGDILDGDLFADGIRCETIRAITSTGR